MFLIYSATYNVQNFSITPLSDGTTNITCVFAINSFADGCNVVFTSSTNNTTTIFVAKSSNKDTATSNVIITNGNYHVAVYDVINPAYTAPDIVIVHYSETVSSSMSKQFSLFLLLLYLNTNCLQAEKQS